MKITEKLRKKYPRITTRVKTEHIDVINNFSSLNELIQYLTDKRDEFRLKYVNFDTSHKLTIDCWDGYNEEFVEVAHTETDEEWEERILVSEDRATQAAAKAKEARYREYKKLKAEFEKSK